MRFGRRSLFFLLLAAINLLLIPPTPSEFRGVNVVMAGLALFWAVMLAVEHVVTRRGRDEAKRAVDPLRRA